MIELVETSGFRNLEPGALRLASGAHLLLGGTGSGKTSLLEALYLGACTRSFRTSRLTDCVRHGADPAQFSVALEVSADARVRLEIGTGEGGLWRLKNGEKSSLREHLSVQPVLAWTSAETDVLTGEPELRRRFVDRGIVGEQSSALPVLQDFRQVLDQKRALLARGGGGARALDSWDDLLAQAISRVAALRASHCSRLSEALQDVQERAGLPFPSLSVSYRPSPSAAVEGPEGALQALQSRRREELDRRRPLLGCHRDRIDVRFGDRSVGQVASAGERKAVGLCLLAAQSELLQTAGKAPLLLLDDLDTELDRVTLERVWSLFQGASQLFASSNRPEVWEGLGLQGLWDVSRGRIEPR